MKMGVYLDVSNLYYSIKRQNKENRINFKDYLEYIKDFGTITVKKAFVGLRGGKADLSFQNMLTQLGFELYTKKVRTYNNKVEEKVVTRKKCDLDVDIAMSLVDDLGKYNRVVMGCADADLIPAYEYISKRGVEVIIFASGISSDLINKYPTYEIPPSVMMK